MFTEMPERSRGLWRIHNLVVYIHYIHQMISSVHENFCPSLSPFARELRNNAPTRLYATFVFYFYTEQNIGRINAAPLCDLT